MLLEVFNGADRREAIAALRPCVDIGRWGEALVDGRPYASVGEVVAAAGSAARPFTPDEIEGALAHHPRIGDRARGDHREAELSRAEQSGLDPSDVEVQHALAEGNREYERRFGRVFLIRAAGRSAGEILDALNERLGHTPDEEDEIVAEQLREIAILRLKGILAR